MLVGYARVSTRDQSLLMQRDALERAGCERIFEETASGAQAARPALSEALAYLRAGDTLTVWKLDRLGRSLRGLLDLSAELEARGVQLRSLTEGLDTGTPGGRLIFHVLAALAEMERELILERSRAGVDAARAQGRTGGRPRALNLQQRDAALRLLDSDMSPAAVARSLGVSESTIRRAARSR